MKVYICNKDFPNLGREAGDFFPTYLFTEEAIADALEKESIYEEEDEFFDEV